MRHDRLTLGTLCTFIDVDCDPLFVTEVMGIIVGTWMYTEQRGPRGETVTRERRFNQDPRTDESAHGYLFMPTVGGGFFYVPFGAVAIGDLTRIT